MLHGVMSWGYGCAQEAHPGVWSRVQYVRDWVDAQLNAPPPTTTTPPAPTTTSAAPSPAAEAQQTMADLLGMETAEVAAASGGWAAQEPTATQAEPQDAGPGTAERVAEEAAGKAAARESSELLAAPEEVERLAARLEEAPTDARAELAALPRATREGLVSQETDWIRGHAPSILQVAAAAARRAHELHDDQEALAAPQSAPQPAHVGAGQGERATHGERGMQGRDAAKAPGRAVAPQAGQGERGTQGRDAAKGLKHLAQEGRCSTALCKKLSAVAAAMKRRMGEAVCRAVLQRGLSMLDKKLETVNKLREKKRELAEQQREEERQEALRAKIANATEPERGRIEDAEAKRVARAARAEERREAARESRAPREKVRRAHLKALRQTAVVTLCQELVAQAAADVLERKDQERAFQREAAEAWDARLRAGDSGPAAAEDSGVDHRAVRPADRALVAAEERSLRLRASDLLVVIVGEVKEGLERRRRAAEADAADAAGAAANASNATSGSNASNASKAPRQAAGGAGDGGAAPEGEVDAEAAERQELAERRLEFITKRVGQALCRRSLVAGLKALRISRKTAAAVARKDKELRREERREAREERQSERLASASGAEREHLEKRAARRQQRAARRQHREKTSAAHKKAGGAKEKAGGAKAKAAAARKEKRQAQKEARAKSARRWAIRGICQKTVASAYKVYIYIYIEREIDR